MCDVDLFTELNIMMMIVSHVKSKSHIQKEQFNILLRTPDVEGRT